MRLAGPPALALATLIACPAVAAAAAAPPRPHAPARATAAGRPAAMLQARGDRFEILRGDTARPLFLRGIDLGAAPPGHFPGEFAITKEQYRRWLAFAHALHANAIRVYTLHPPAFYEALKEENDSHPDDPLWLFQEVWAEPPPRADFWDSTYTRGFEDDVRLAIDAVHGRADAPVRPGHAHGRYRTDVSMYLGGWLLGREWESSAVRDTQARHPNIRRFDGAWFTVPDGTAMECWLGRVLDAAVSYEAKRYGLAHAASFVTWPTLDPMRHPTEYERGGKPAEEDEDEESVDPLHIRLRVEPSPASRCLGYFANYHVYPYYPDFMNLDPGYSAFRDAHGACNYAGYLTDLKAHTRGIPLLIGEYGVPGSRGIAHQQPQGLDHGGMSETQQGEDDVRLLTDIAETGCAGSLLFSLFDEWFKVNWLVMKTEQPRGRTPLWHNLLDAEESYGLIGFDPPPRIHVDGDTLDWAGIEPYAVARAAPGTDRTSGDPSRGNAPLRALYVTSDQNRFYLRFDLEPGALAGTRALGAMLDVLDPARGDRRLPPPLRATWSRGAEFLLVVQPDRRLAELYIDAATDWSVFARRLVEGRFEPVTTPYRPVANDEGRYLPLLIETNRERVARNGKVYPAQHLDWGRLEYGREPPRAAAWPGADSAYAYDPHAEWYVGASGRTIEVAIPWGLLEVGDPSSRRVVDDRDGTPAVETSVTSGIGILAWATRARGFEADSLGPEEPVSTISARPAECQFLGPEGTTQAISNESVMVATPPDRSYLWNGWDMPITLERIKRSAPIVRNAFEELEARETHEISSIETR